MKIFFSFAGLVLIALGFFTLIHSEIRMPAKKEEVQIARGLEFETRSAIFLRFVDTFLRVEGNS